MSKETTLGTDDVAKDTTEATEAAKATTDAAARPVKSILLTATCNTSVVGTCPRDCPWQLVVRLPTNHVSGYGWSQAPAPDGDGDDGMIHLTSRGRRWEMPCFPGGYAPESQVEMTFVMPTKKKEATLRLVYAMPWAREAEVPGRKRETAAAPQKVWQVVVKAYGKQWNAWGV